MVDLSSVYVSNGYPGTQAEGAVLRCHDHPDWEVDIDGTAVLQVIFRATDHVKDDHDGEH